MESSAIYQFKVSIGVYFGSWRVHAQLPFALQHYSKFGFLHFCWWLSDLSLLFSCMDYLQCFPKKKVSYSTHFCFVCLAVAVQYMIPFWTHPTVLLPISISIFLLSLEYNVNELLYQESGRTIFYHLWENEVNSN